MQVGWYFFSCPFVSFRCLKKSGSEFLRFGKICLEKVYMGIIFQIVFFYPVFATLCEEHDQSQLPYPYFVMPSCRRNC